MSEISGRPFQGSKLVRGVKRTRESTAIGALGSLSRKFRNRIHFISSLGFALQRANSRMLRIADRRRHKARSCGLCPSGTRPPPLPLDDGY